MLNCGSCRTEQCPRLNVLKAHAKMLFSCFGVGKKAPTTTITPTTRRPPRRPIRPRSSTEQAAAVVLAPDSGDGERKVEKKRVKRKVVVVGDGECGKTCLLQRICRDTYRLQGYLPTVFDTDVLDVELDSVTVELMLVDTAGQEDYDRLRPYSYQDADAVLICFAIDNPTSLENVRLNWVPEVRHFLGSHVPLLLVGNKCDLRHQGERIAQFSVLEDLSDFPECSPSAALIKQGPVKVSSAELLAEEVGAVGYWETSALLDQGVREVFLAASSVALYGGDPEVSSRKVKRRKKSKSMTNNLMVRLRMKKSRQS